MAKTTIFGRTFNQTRNIGHGNCFKFLSVINYTDCWHKGGKWVSIHFGRGIGHYVEQCGLTCIGKTDQTDIGNSFECKNKLTLHTRFTLCKLARCLIYGRFKSRIPPPSFSTFEKENFLFMVH